MEVEFQENQRVVLLEQQNYTLKVQGGERLKIPIRKVVVAAALV
jgi:hypothetical protein